MRRRRAQTATEYGILLALLAVAVMAIASVVGRKVRDTHTTVASSLDVVQTGQLPPSGEPAETADDSGGAGDEGDGEEPAPPGPDEYGEDPPDFPGDEGGDEGGDVGGDPPAEDPPAEDPPAEDPPDEGGDSWWDWFMQWLAGLFG